MTSTPPLGRLDLNELQVTLRTLGLDGWLLYDFHGVNPVARRVTGLGGFITRRAYVWLPASGKPIALVHRIERDGLADFPGEVQTYASWRELEQKLASMIRGRRLAVELSPEGRVPYLDRIPAGAAHVLERLGAVLTGSEALVTRFAARWSVTEREEHRAVAEILADVARSILGEVVRRTGATTEVEVQARVLERLRRADLDVVDPPIIAFGHNTASPHYVPREGANGTLREGDVVLLDLWARRHPDSVFADQTWMGFAGTALPDEVATVWQVVLEARNAVLERLHTASQTGTTLTGAALDDVARGVITDHGYGEAFPHRTGHSIDNDVHGSGPHLDNFETNDTRALLPGIGFTVEPGIYLEGRFGMRSEVNVYLSETGPEVTPGQIQGALIRPV